MTFACEVLEGVDGELYIQLPEELLEQLGWDADDSIQWLENQDKSFTLRKIADDSST